MTINSLKLIPLLAITLLTFAQSNSDAQTTAYTGATLETMTEAGQLKNGTLVIRGDKIIDVGTDVKIPDDARVVSLNGKTVMPGLVDPYFVFRTGSSTGTAPQTSRLTGEHLPSIGEQHVFLQAALPVSESTSIPTSLILNRPFEPGSPSVI